MSPHRLALVIGLALGVAAAGCDGATLPGAEGPAGPPGPMGPSGTGSPALASVLPGTLRLGATIALRLVVVDHALRGAPRVAIGDGGDGVEVLTAAADGPGAATALVHVADDAAIGARDVTLTDDEGPLLARAAITVAPGLTVERAAGALRQGGFARLLVTGAEEPLETSWPLDPPFVWTRTLTTGPPRGNPVALDVLVDPAAPPRAPLVVADLVGRRTVSAPMAIEAAEAERLGVGLHVGTLARGTTRLVELDGPAEPSLWSVRLNRSTNIVTGTFAAPGYPSLSTLSPTADLPARAGAAPRVVLAAYRDADGTYQLSLERRALTVADEQVDPHATIATAQRIALSGPTLIGGRLSQPQERDVFLLDGFGADPTYVYVAMATVGGARCAFTGPGATSPVALEGAPRLSTTQGVWTRTPTATATLSCDGPAGATYDVAVWRSP